MSNKEEAFFNRADCFAMTSTARARLPLAPGPAFPLQPTRCAQEMPMLRTSTYT